VTQPRLDGGVGVGRGRDGGLVVPVVPAGAGADAREDAVHGDGTLVEDGRDEEGGAEEELAVDCEECGCGMLVLCLVMKGFGDSRSLGNSQARARIIVEPVVLA